MLKKSLYIIFICSTTALGLHLYLSVRSYSLSVDTAGKSAICHINESLNCDHALSSVYSEFAGIPLSNWGFVLHLLISLMTLLLLMGESEKTDFIRFLLRVLSGFSAGASLIMMGISFFLLNFFCPICIVLYLLSFIIFICAFFSTKNQFKILSLKTLRGFFPVVAGWVLMSFLLHLIFIKTYDIQSVEQTVKRNLMDWVSEPVRESGEKALLSKGPEKAVTTITEFADFLCVFCKKSYYVLRSMTALDSQIKVEYFSFPLDECKGKRASCALTRAVFCAEKQNQGWNMHDIIFERQKVFMSLTDEKVVLEKLKGLSAHLPLVWEDWSKCLQSSLAFSAVKKQIKAGGNVRIKGTPFILVNGKRINNQYLTRTIKSIHQKQKKNK